MLLCARASRRDAECFPSYTTMLQQFKWQITLASNVSSRSIELSKRCTCRDKLLLMKILHSRAILTTGATHTLHIACQCDPSAC